MFDETMFTTTDTGRPAPTWHQSFDGPRLYWRNDYWDKMQEVNRAANDSARIGTTLEAVKANSEISNPFFRGTKAGTCIICEKPFTNGQPDQVTCGGDACKAERQRQRASKSYQRQAKVTRRTCPVCDETFSVTYRNKTQKTCGDPGCTSEARSRAGRKAHEKEASHATG